MRLYRRTRGERRGPKSTWQRSAGPAAPASPPAPAPAPRAQRRQLEQLQERVARGEIADITPAEWVLIERARKADRIDPLLAEAKAQFEAALEQVPGHQRGRPRKHPKPAPTKSTITGARGARSRS